MPEQIHKDTIKSRPVNYGPDVFHPLCKFEKRCLYCGRLNYSVTYTCNCCSKTWFNEYRTLDLKPLYSPVYKEKILQSYQNYDFDHADGIAQYKGLPFREWYPKQIDPVGMTPLYYLKHLSARLETQLFIKNEGENPSGCFKDRETLMALLNSRRRGLRHAVIYSSGNAAASAALFARKLNMQLITFVAGDTYPEKINFIRAHGSDVIVVGNENTNFEEGFRIFAKINAAWIFASAGFDNWSVRNPYRVQGDKTTAIEIVKQLTYKFSTPPDWIIIPTANGSCLTGIWKGFLELKQLGIISTLPKLVAAGIQQASPIFQAVQKKQTHKPERCDLSKADPEDATIGSTILAEEGYDSMEATKSVLASGGLSVLVNHVDIKKALRLFLQLEGGLALKHAILPEPAALVSIAAIEKIRQRVTLASSETVVSLITGHGLKAREVLKGLLPNNPELHNLVDRIIARRKAEVPRTLLKKGKRRNVAADYGAVVKAFHELKRNDD